MFLVRIVLTVSILVVALAGSARSQTMEQYRALCPTVEGRRELAALLSPESKYDLASQTEAGGADLDTHVRNAIEKTCAWLVPGSVVPKEPSQAWSFPAETIGAPLPGEGPRTLRAAADPPRCGPNCKGGFTVEYSHPRWQVCRLRYRTNYENRGKSFPHDLPGAQVEIRPTGWMDSTRFRGFTVLAEAWQHSFIELSNLELDVVDAELTVEQRKTLGCLLPSADYVEQAGRLECKETRGGDGARDRDDCTITQRAVGARRFVRSPLMRKVIISKPAGDTGEEVIIKRVNGSTTGRVVLRPGEQHELLKPPPQTQYRDFSVDIETTKAGANGTSQYSLTLEWYSN